MPDLPARPLPELVRAAAQANAYVDDARYSMAGQGLGALLVELHVRAATGGSEERQAALVALAEACMVAYCLAYRIGHADLAVIAASTPRGWSVQLPGCRDATMTRACGSTPMSATCIACRPEDDPGAAAVSRRR